MTPLVGVVADGAPHFTTGMQEQKGRNLAANPQVVLTTGENRWNAGLDVVVEGRAVQLADDAALRRVAAAYVEKYGDAWRFDVRDGCFHHGGPPAAVFRVEPAKLLAFAKQPHGQTSYRFA